MADVTISSLPLGTPSGSALLPYSQGGNTLSVSPSALLQNVGNIGIGISNPYAKLHLAGNNVDTSIIVDAQSSGGGSASLRLIRNSIGFEELRLIAGATLGGLNNAYSMDLIGNPNVRGFLIRSSVDGGANYTQLVNVTPGSGNVQIKGQAKIDSGYIDTTGSEVYLENNAYIDFPLASGMLIVNAIAIAGVVTCYLVGGTGVGVLGSSRSPNAGTVTYNLNPHGYRFTNNLLGLATTFSFCFIKTRNYP